MTTTDDRADLLAEIIVWYADNGGVSDRRVRGENVFDLLRIDVDAARQDQV